MYVYRSSVILVFAQFARHPSIILPDTRHHPDLFVLSVRLRDGSAAVQQWQRCAREFYWATGGKSVASWFGFDKQSWVFHDGQVTGSIL